MKEEEEERFFLLIILLLHSSIPDHLSLSFSFLDPSLIIYMTSTGVAENLDVISSH